MYTPDRSFMKELKTLDKNLGCKFNGRFFVVTYQRSYGEPVNLYAIKGPDNSFRPPGQKDIEIIAASNIERESPKEKSQRISKHMEDVREKKRKEARENIRNMTKDDRRQLSKAFMQLTNLGKGNSAFRRVNVKPKRKSETI